jgi:hypothetical protein
MIIIGCDPGVTGAMSFFYHGGERKVVDLPVREKADSAKIKNEIDPLALRTLLRAHVPADEKALVVMESAHAFIGGANGTRKVGSLASQASLAATKAVVCAVCELSGLDVAYVTPREWQALYGIAKTDSEDTKAQSVRIARGLYPEFRLAKNNGRADALLIGRYGQRHFA